MAAGACAAPGGRAASFGLAFFFPLLSWLVNVAWYAWAALAVAEAVIFAMLDRRAAAAAAAARLAAGGRGLVGRCRGAPRPVAVTGSRGARLAMSQATAPTARWVAIGGPPLLTFLLALAGGPPGLAGARPGRGPGPRGAYSLRPRSSRPWRSAWRRGLAACPAALLPGGPALPAQRRPPTAVVAAIQGNVPHARNLPNLLRATTVTANHAAATEQLAAQVAGGRAAGP